MKNFLPRVGFEPVMPQVGWDLKQRPTKWIAYALPLSYGVTLYKMLSRHQTECFYGLLVTNTPSCE